VRYYNWIYGRASGGNFTYISIPDAPDFGFNYNTLYSADDDRQIVTADLLGYTNIFLGEEGVPYSIPQLELFELVGSIGTPIRFRGGGGKDNPFATRIGDATQGGYALRGNASEYIQLYDMEIYGDSCLVWELESREIRLQNVELNGGGVESEFSGFRSKTDENNTLTPYKIYVSYSRAYDTEGEGLYFGNSLSAVYHNLEYVQIIHTYIHDTGWEGFHTGMRRTHLFPM